jgi:hypothetical protein
MQGFQPEAAVLRGCESWGLPVRRTPDDLSTSGQSSDNRTPQHFSRRFVATSADALFET